MNLILLPLVALKKDSGKLSTANVVPLLDTFAVDGNYSSATIVTAITASLVQSEQGHCCSVIAAKMALLTAVK